MWTTRVAMTRSAAAVGDVDGGEDGRDEDGGNAQNGDDGHGGVSLGWRDGSAGTFVDDFDDGDDGGKDDDSDAEVANGGHGEVSLRWRGSGNVADRISGDVRRFRWR